MLKLLSFLFLLLEKITIEDVFHQQSKQSTITFAATNSVYVINFVSYITITIQILSKTLNYLRLICLSKKKKGFRFPLCSLTRYFKRPSWRLHISIYIINYYFTFIHNKHNKTTYYLKIQYKNV